MKADYVVDRHNDMLFFFCPTCRKELFRCENFSRVEKQYYGPGTLLESNTLQIVWREGVLERHQCTPYPWVLEMPRNCVNDGCPHEHGQLCCRECPNPCDSRCVQADKEGWCEQSSHALGTEQKSKSLF